MTKNFGKRAYLMHSEVVKREQQILFLNLCYQAYQRLKIFIIFVYVIMKSSLSHTLNVG